MRVNSLPVEDREWEKVHVAILYTLSGRKQDSTQIKMLTCDGIVGKVYISELYIVEFGQRSDSI